jgi:hypothetical protein
LSLPRPYRDSSDTWGPGFDHLPSNLGHFRTFATYSRALKTLRPWLVRCREHNGILVDHTFGVKAIETEAGPQNSDWHFALQT